MLRPLRPKLLRREKGSILGRNRLKRQYLAKTFESLGQIVERDSRSYRERPFSRLSLFGP